MSGLDIFRIMLGISEILRSGFLPSIRALNVLLEDFSLVLTGSLHVVE